MIITPKNLDISVNKYCIEVLHNQLRTLIHKYILNPYTTFRLSCPIVPYFEDESIQGDGLEQRKQHVHLIFKKIYEDELWYIQNNNLSSANPVLIEYDNVYLSVLIADNLSILIKFESAIIRAMINNFTLNASLYLGELHTKLFVNNKNPAFILIRDINYTNDKIFNIIPKEYAESRLKNILLVNANQNIIAQNIINNLVISKVSSMGITKYFIKFDFH